MSDVIFSVLAIVVCIGIVFPGMNNVLMVNGQGGCQGDIGGLIMQCAVYVQKGMPVMDPSQGCCNVVKTVDIPCVCQRITMQIEQVVDMAKVVHIASYCSRPLAHGTKCGSYTVP